MRTLSLLAVAVMAAVATPVAASAQDKDLVETVAAVGNVKTFTKLLADAGLTLTLKGPGPFTVFAPSDEAFAKLPASTLDALTKDRGRLRNVLLYHLVAGRISAADALKLAGTGTKTVEGSEAKVSATGGTLMINSAHIVKADIPARNGVVHVIDAVMMLPAR